MPLSVLLRGWRVLAWVWRVFAGSRIWTGGATATLGSRRLAGKRMAAIALQHRPDSTCICRGDLGERERDVKCPVAAPRGSSNSSQAEEAEPVSMSIGRSWARHPPSTTPSPVRRCGRTSH
ncbi:hypothetical protein K490DRAFT_59470 [Saccharata proteae CBS 121410]|uniref:Uncharacterized protein n=1 Tax=Saccharata proteae CBS 121410 TaxID=1314787 RepID=A0A9P4HQD0_9PEZI|nr:hypothetical protein K490DRAFT_59470 [Saccharata proteae CBS 121410]